MPILPIFIQSLAEPIDWTQDELVSARMTAFREGTVWPHILQEVSVTNMLMQRTQHTVHNNGSYEM